jgi:hypothetical protein
MGEARTNWKVPITVALITGLSVIVAAAIPGVIPHMLRWLAGDHPNKYVNGVVSDALTKAPMPGVVVRLESNEGKLLTQDTTDHDGKFNLPIQGDVEVIRVLASADGYTPYEQKLPAQETRNDIQLTRQRISSGIPNGFPLDGAAGIVASKLNITVVFGTGCNKKDRAAPLNGGQLEGDPRAPEEMLKDLLTRVKDNRRRYSTITIESGKRYEIDCSS